MSGTKSVDISGVEFVSTVYPTAEDKALWKSLTPEQRLAILERDEELGHRSGTAKNASLPEVLAEIRAEAEG